ncbi:hypothetical protein AB0J52_34530, partial [Spirillospora sp. NPDC049652]
MDTAHDVEPPAPEPAPAPEPLGRDEDAPGGKPRETFAVRMGMTWRTAWRGLAFGILMAASAGFVAGGVMRGGFGVGSLAFIVLGAVGLVAFGGGFLAAVGGPLARRPVLELTAEGVRRPARWPLPRSR